MNTSSSPAPSTIYWFPLENPAFETAQDKGYVNVYNKTEEQNGIHFTVQAIVSDQLTTYVRIKATGDLPKNPNDEWSLTDKIENAYLTDAEGNRLQYRDQTVDTGGNGLGMIIKEPAINSPKLSEALSKNEAVLVFYGGPSEDTTFSLAVIFKGEKARFNFEGLKAKIPPIVKRSFDGISFQTSYATGVVKEITYSMLETRFKIDWSGIEIDDAYMMENDGLYKNDNEKYRYMLPYPNLYSDDGKTYTNIFVLDRPLNPKADLRIDRYTKHYESFIDEFLFIPASVS